MGIKLIMHKREAQPDVRLLYLSRNRPKSLLVGMVDGMGDFNVFSRTGSGNRHSEKGGGEQRSKGVLAHFFDESNGYPHSYRRDKLPFFFLFSGSGRLF